MNPELIILYFHFPKNTICGFLFLLRKKKYLFFLGPGARFLCHYHGLTSRSPLMSHLPPVILQVIWLKGRDPHTSQAHTTAQTAALLAVHDPSPIMPCGCRCGKEWLFSFGDVSSFLWMSGRVAFAVGAMSLWNKTGCGKAGQGPRWQEPGGDPTYRVLVDETRPQLLEGRPRFRADGEFNLSFALYCFVQLINLRAPECPHRRNVSIFLPYWLPY